MTRLLRLLTLSILLSFYSISVYAVDKSAYSDEKPEFIPIIKKPCYIGCDYLFQFCYNYNISNMNDAIKVKEWNFEDDYLTGKAVADIKARLLIKMCYQVSLTSSYAVIDEDLNFKSEFEFKIKFNRNSKDQCIDFQEYTINFSSYDFLGDISTDPIPRMLGQLDKDIGEIIQDSVIYKVLSDNNGDNNIYCDLERYKTDEDNFPCRCY